MWQKKSLGIDGFTKIWLNQSVSLLMQMFQSERPMFRISIDVLVYSRYFIKMDSSASVQMCWVSIRPFDIRADIPFFDIGADVSMLMWLFSCGCGCFRAVLDDFRTARKVFDEDEDVKTVAEALQLSQDGLQYDPHQLPTQLICRINSAPKVMLTQTWTIWNKDDC